MRHDMDKLKELNRRQQAGMLPRGRRALRLRAAGETWASIGLLLGVSRQRAQALALQAERALKAMGQAL